MGAIAGGIFGWLLKNPALVVCALLAAGLGIQTLRLANAQSDLSHEKLAFSDYKRSEAEQSAKLIKETADKAATAMTNLAVTVAGIHDIAAEAKTEIRYVQSNGGPCAQDPAYLAGIDAVQRLQLQRNGGGAGSAKASDPGRAPAPVRGAGTPVPR